MLLSVAIGLAFYLAWNLGANDVANSMGTSVGSKALTIGQALVIAAVLEFTGAMVFGQGVSQKLATGVLEVQQYAGHPEIFIQGMLAVLLSAGLWMNLATFFGLPVSSSHAVVGAIAGFGTVSLGVQAVQWSSLGMISATWLGTPLISGTIAALLYGIILQLRTRLPEPYASDSESRFARLQVISACGVAFAHGSNDVGNAIAPLAAIVNVLQTQQIPTQAIPIPLWIVAIGGLGLVGGLAVWGKNVILTIGEGLIELKPSGGFCAELATAITVLLASSLGLPVSTSHALVGAVIGIGVMNDYRTVQWGQLRSIVLTWFGTIPVSVGLSAGIYWLIHLGFNIHS